MDFLNYFNAWFWSDTFWLPPNTTWSDLNRRTDEIFYPSAHDLWIPIPIALLLLIIRFIFERYIAHPIGRQHNLKDSIRRVHPNSILESEFKNNKKSIKNKDTILRLRKQTDMTERQIERWWRVRRTQDKPSELQRFRETSWRFVFYVFSFWGGVYALWDKSWLWDTRQCWIGYPKQHIPVDIRVYYMLELAFYWSLIFSLVVDTKRKDAVEMFVHHVVTIVLMCMSWSANMVRVGSLILCLHDAVDYIMECGKLFNYCKYKRMTNLFFVLFATCWLITRIIAYPLWILRSTLFEAPSIVGMANIYYAYNGLLCVLQLLHIVWFVFILRMAYQYIINGQIEKDERSDTDPDSETDDQQIKSSK